MALPYLSNNLSTASSYPELCSLVSLLTITLKELISMNLVYECRNESVLLNNCFYFKPAVSLDHPDYVFVLFK